jgi:hypothetical protein
MYKPNDSTYGNNAGGSYDSPKYINDEELKHSSHQRYRSIESNNPYNSRNLSLRNLKTESRKAYLTFDKNSNKPSVPIKASYLTRDDRIKISQRYHDFRNKQSIKQRGITVGAKKDRKILNTRRLHDRYVY